MKKKLVSLSLAMIMLFSLGTTATAAEMSAADAYRDEASQISREALEQLLQKVAPAYPAYGVNSIAGGEVKSEASEEEIANLFSERSFAVSDGDMDTVSQIDRELESYGYYDVSREDLEVLFGGDLTAAPLAYGPPTKPGNTDFVEYKLNPGTTPGGYDYVNIVATSVYAPDGGVYKADSLPLYNCKELNIYPSKNNYTATFLKESLQLAADEATSKLKTIPGILASKFAEIVIGEFFQTGQSFGASAFAATHQVMVFSYLADVPNYYTHYVTAEQCNMIVVYYFAYNDGSGSDTDIAKNRVSFVSKNFSAPQNQAEKNINDGWYMRDSYYCGKIQLTYPTMEGTDKTVTLSRQYYSELYSIPGT